MQKRMRARLPIAGAQWSTHFGMPTRHCRLAVWRPSAWSTAAAAETRSLLFLPYLLMRSQLCTAATEWGVLPAPEMLVPLGTAIPMAQCVRCVTWWKVKSNRKYQSFAFWRSLSLSPKHSSLFTWSTLPQPKVNLPAFQRTSSFLISSTSEVPGGCSGGCGSSVHLKAWHRWTWARAISEEKDNVSEKG